jgi:hypothetical protein
MVTTPKFTWSDAWLLFAVALAATSGKVTLKDVIACGDGIQHAIFTPAELRRGFAKLIARATSHITARTLTSLQRCAKFSRWLAAADRDAHAAEAIRDVSVGRAISSRQSSAEDPEWPFPQITDAWSVER